MSFRIADVRDIPALHALIESAYRGESAKAGWTHEADLLGGQRTDVQALGEIIADDAQVILMAEEAGDLRGCVLVADIDHGRAYLGMLTVRPDLQSAGIGAALLAEAEDLARNVLRAAAMEMTVIKRRRELIAWYERRGYRNTGREAPFPSHDPRFGLPKVDDLVFVVLEKTL
ncbi:MAG: GNAT family N-acetyltransferase [Hyphomonadaceae bacterium]|nr:GNAT family N-acetyltransferase [Hyphomonadaceae bacterium]